MSSPQNGPGAPTGVDVDPKPPARHGPAPDDAGFGSNFPPTPESASSTPWGSTSTVTGGQNPPQGTPNAGVTYPPPPPPPGSEAPGRPAAPPSGRRAARARGPRRARLQLRHIDAWTVLKFSCVLSIALFFVWLIVIGVLFGVLDATGIIQKINDSITTINGANAKPPVTPGIVFGGAAIIGVVNIVLFIAITTIGSVVYNLCADLVGGIEVTLSER
jgi:Transmembrane domain of unknown function (DUF3566)